MPRITSILLRVMIITLASVTCTPVRIASDKNTLINTAQHTQSVPFIDSNGVATSVLPDECHSFPINPTMSCLVKFIRDTCLFHHTPNYASLLGVHTDYAHLLNMYVYTFPAFLVHHPSQRDAFTHAFKDESGLPFVSNGTVKGRDIYFELKCKEAVPASRHFETWFRKATSIYLFFSSE